MIRIANGQGFWGDWLEAPVRLVDQGPIDFLVLDYLAEVTMSILQKQKQEDPPSATPATFRRSSAVLRANSKTATSRWWPMPEESTRWPAHKPF